MHFHVRLVYLSCENTGKDMEMDTQIFNGPLNCYQNFRPKISSPLAANTWNLPFGRNHCSMFDGYINEIYRRIDHRNWFLLPTILINKTKIYWRKNQMMSIEYKFTYVINLANVIRWLINQLINASDNEWISQLAKYSCFYPPSFAILTKE